jgi:hypothetical protein
VNDEAVALCFELAMGADEGLGRGPLEKCARLGVEGRAEKVVRCGIADVELDGGIEGDEFDEVGFEKCALFDGRMLLESFGAKFLHRTQGRDVEADLLREGGLQQNEEETTEMEMAGFQGMDASQ